MIKSANLCDFHQRIRPLRVGVILYRFRLKIRAVIDCLIFSIGHTEIARTVRVTNPINPRVWLIQLVLNKSKIRATNCIGSLYKIVATILKLVATISVELPKKITRTITRTNCINSHDKLVLVILEISHPYFCCDLIQLTKTSRLLISVTGYQKLARLIRPLNFIVNGLQLVLTRTIAILCRSNHKLSLTI